MGKNKTDCIVATEGLGDITVKELLNNETAITMLLKDYKRVSDENQMMRQDLNRQATFERELSVKNARTKIAAALSFIVALTTAFGVNLITSSSEGQINIGGVVLVIVSVTLEIIVLVLTLGKSGGKK